MVAWKPKFVHYDPRPKPCVIVVGKIFGNKDVWGPFSDTSDAEAWIKKHPEEAKKHYEIIPIKSHK